MKRFKSVLLIPPIGLTSAASPRVHPEFLKLKDTTARGKPKTDRKNNRTWSSTHASCSPVDHEYIRIGSTHTHLSSTFALPSTSSPPVRPRTHGRSCAKKYAITIRKR